MKLDENAIREALRAVKDPDLGKDLVTLGMIKGIGIEGGKVKVSVELTTPACPLKKKIEDDCRAAVMRVPGVQDVTIDMTANTAANRAATGMPSRVPGVRNIVAVASGKGGVGKSTVAVNLALALQRLGARVGVLDADIYGPSIPTMLAAGRTIEASGTQDQKIIPAEMYGLKVVSIGFFIERGSSVVWRGPMVHKMIQQFLEDVLWGELDYLICDLPPGTGDVQLSLSQLIPLAGAVMVSTPQEVALADVLKGVDMFRRVRTPIVGMVENMSTYLCPHCGHEESIFDHGGAKRAAAEHGIPFLGEIPLNARVRIGGDRGAPVVAGDPEGPFAKVFLDIAGRLAANLSMINVGGGIQTNLKPASVA
jgi:ATP-binding protein involved in chromosome partitioning